MRSILPCQDARPHGLPDDIRAACARVAAPRAPRPDRRGRGRGLRARRCPPPRRPRPTSRPARRRGRAPPSGCSSTRSTSARAGSPRCASRPGCRASAPSRRACARTARGARGELARVDAARGRRDVRRPGPGARADGPVRPRAARARRARARRARRLVPRARPRGGGSAEALAERLGALPTWRDVSPYDGEPVPFFKRAQLAAADLHLQGIAPARDLAALTLFADNLVPHVLRLDGVLRVRRRRWSRASTARSCSSTTRPRRSRSAPARVHAVELLVAAHGGDDARPRSTTCSGTAAAAPRYKARPRHRARTTAY